MRFFVLFSIIFDIQTGVKGNSRFLPPSFAVIAYNRERIFSKTIRNQKILNISLESYDAELTFLGVRMPMCPMCEHVAHDTHQAREQKKNRKKSIFSKFLRIRKFSENFSQIFFCQKVAENHLISITCSFEQNRSIRSDLRAF